MRMRAGVQHQFAARACKPAAGFQSGNQQAALANLVVCGADPHLNAVA